LGYPSPKRRSPARKWDRSRRERPYVKWPQVSENDRSIGWLYARWRWLQQSKRKTSRCGKRRTAGGSGCTRTVTRQVCSSEIPKTSANLCICCIATETAPFRSCRTERTLCAILASRVRPRATISTISG
ncbi:unnamed protein product, partial [Pylaiella littoralis]